jgi:hypothetical protein
LRRERGSVRGVISERSPVSLRVQFIALLSLVGVIAVTSAVASGNSPAFKVNSTLDGKRVLPARMRWIAYPKLPASKVSKVDFLVDGKLRWVEHQPPYNYGSDDLKGHLGFLVTTWLAPGKHRFAARVTDRSGHKATDTVSARVLPAPAPPAALAGAWSRPVTAEDITKSGPQPPPAGRWKLIFDRVGAWHIDPDNGGVVNQYAARPGLIDVFAPITMAPKGVNRFGTHGFGCCDCREDGPFGSYNWSVSGNKLTLKARHEGCPNRRAIWEGVWTKQQGG